MKDIDDYCRELRRNKGVNVTLELPYSEKERAFEYLRLNGYDENIKDSRNPFTKHADGSYIMFGMRVIFNETQ